MVRWRIAFRCSGDLYVLPVWLFFFFKLSFSPLWLEESQQIAKESRERSAFCLFYSNFSHTHTASCFHILLLSLDFTIMCLQLLQEKWVPGSILSLLNRRICQCSFSTSPSRTFFFSSQNHLSVFQYSLLLLLAIIYLFLFIFSQVVLN